MHPCGAWTFLVQAVAMNGQHMLVVIRQPQAVRFKGDAGVVAPEGVTPAVVVAANHGHWDAPCERGQRGSDPEVAPGDEAAVAEPEIEDVACQEQGVTLARYGVQEPKHGGFVVGRRGTEVGIGEDHQAGGMHGAKGDA